MKRFWSARVTEESGHRAVARPETASEEPAGAPQAEPSESPTTDESRQPTALNERQNWPLAELKRGTKRQVRHLIDRFGCSSATAKRDLTALKTAGLVRFLGSARAGHFQTTSIHRPRPSLAPTSAGTPRQIDVTTKYPLEGSNQRMPMLAFLRDER